MHTYVCAILPYLFFKSRMCRDLKKSLILTLDGQKLSEDLRIHTYL
jgi:hypothetical protein